MHFHFETCDHVLTEKVTTTVIGEGSQALVVSLKNTRAAMNALKANSTWC
jgi:hypothetical protein